MPPKTYESGRQGDQFTPPAWALQQRLQRLGKSLRQVDLDCKPPGLNQGRLCAVPPNSICPGTKNQNLRRSCPLPLSQG